MYSLRVDNDTRLSEADKALLHRMIKHHSRDTLVALRRTVGVARALVQHLDALIGAGEKFLKVEVLEDDAEAREEVEMYRLLREKVLGSLPALEKKASERLQAEVAMEKYADHRAETPTFRASSKLFPRAKQKAPQPEPPAPADIPAIAPTVRGKE